jgi:hypothetical protein
VNYYNTLIEVADDCPVSEAQAPQARGGKKTKPALEYELLAGHPYTYREEDIAFEVYAILHDIPKAAWPKQRERFLSKGHPRLRVSALPKRRAGAFTTTPKARSRGLPLSRRSTSGY